MMETPEGLPRCPNCNTGVQQDDDFCPACGGILADDVFCAAHPAASAAGVCIVCATPCCRDCGGRVQDRFLCSRHDMLEIYEGMARVYGTSDALQADYAASSLETAGLHPFVFSRKASPISLGGPDYTLFRAAGDYDGHIINEFKVMVPCREFAAAEAVLAELEITGSGPDPLPGNPVNS
jgi:hypothetical protein